MALADFLDYFRQDDDDRFLESIFKGIVRPVTEGGRFLGEGLGYLGGLTGNQISRLLGGEGVPLWKYQEQYEPRFYQKDEWSDITRGDRPFLQDPALKTGLQRGLGFASMIPIGKAANIGQAVARGALSGGLYSASETDDIFAPQAIGDIVLGSGLGAAGGAAGYKLSELGNKLFEDRAIKSVDKIQKLTDKAVDKRIKALGLELNDIADTPTKARTKFRNVWNTLSSEGYDLSTPEKVVDALGDYTNIAKPRIEKAATGTRKSIPKKPIIDIIDDFLGRIKDRGSKQNIEYVRSFVEQQPDKIPISEAIKIKDILQRLRGFDRLGTTGAPEKITLDNLFFSIRDKIDEAVPQISKDLRTLSNALGIKSESGLLKSMEKPTRVSMGALKQIPLIPYSANIKPQVGKFLLSQAQRAEQRAANRGIGMLGNIGKNISTVGQQTGQALGALMPRAIESMFNQPSKPEGSDSIGMENMGGQINTVSTILKPEYQQPSQQYGEDMGTEQRINILQSLISQGLSPNEALSLVEYVYPSQQEEDSGKMLTSGVVNKISEVQQGLDLLDDLQKEYEQSKEAFGPIIGNIRARIPWDNKGQAAKATIRTVRQIIGKGLEEGVLRKEDESKYREILPKLGDTRATVEAKIDRLRETLINKYQSLVGSYGAAGYDISGFGQQDISSDYNSWME